MHRQMLPLTIACLSAATSAAQSPTKTGARTLMSPDVEIALARSAAPAAISTGARVWVLTPKGYVIADSGKTSVNCYVGRPWVGAVEPHCLDAEASATILPIQRFRVEQLAGGKSGDEVEREVALGLASGKFRLPSRPAITYMMSARQDLVTGEGVAVGRWEPHLMIYYPYLTSEETGLFAGFVAGVGFVENPGQALAALVIPVKEFVGPADSTKR